MMFHSILIAEGNIDSTQDHSNVGAEADSTTNQPTLNKPSEKDDAEQLRLSNEVANLAREEEEYREKLQLIQQNLSRASFSVLPPDQLPSGFHEDIRNYLNMDPAKIAHAEEYYRLLAEILSDLNPGNLNTATANSESIDLPQLGTKIKKLSEYSEDEGISRELIAHFAAVKEANSEKVTLARSSPEAERTALEKRRREVMRNIAIAAEPNRLRGGYGAGVSSIPMYQQEIRQIDDRLAELQGRAPATGSAHQKGTAEVKFQKFILELAFQGRYVHSFIASRLYRLYARQLSISPDTYQRSTRGFTQPSATLDGETSTPHFEDIPSLESFLMSRNSDSRKARTFFDNGLRSHQLAAADNQLRELFVIAQYQPELHTIPYVERQKILTFSKNVRELYEAVSTRNYQKVFPPAEKLETLSNDLGINDVKSFAALYSTKASQWVKDADSAMKLGDTSSMRSLIKAAYDTAPFVPEVQKASQQIADLLVGQGDSRNDIGRGTLTSASSTPQFGFSEQVPEVLQAGQGASNPAQHAASQPSTLSSGKPLREAIAQDAALICKALSDKGISNVAVARIYANGSGASPLSEYVQREAMGELVAKSDPDKVQFVERYDGKLLLKENQLEWNTTGTFTSTAHKSEAILMGELLISANYRQALLALRSFRSDTAEIIAGN